MVGKENVLPASSWPSSRACRHTGTKAHYLFYPHSVIRRLTTSHLKRVISKMPRRPGGTVYECKIVSTPLRKKTKQNKNPQKAQAQKPLRQPCTQSNLESRLTGPTPGSRSELLHKAAMCTSQPLAQLRRHSHGFQFESSEVEKGGGSCSVRTPPPLWPLYDSTLWAGLPQALEEEIVPKQKTIRVAIPP